MKKNEIIALLKEEFENILKLNELELFDSRGQLIIGKDLKVMHDPSGYVYTVKNIEGQPGSAKITLRAPEAPRVKSNRPNQVSIPLKNDQGNSANNSNSIFGMQETEKEVVHSKVDVGEKAHPDVPAPPPQENDDDVFVVDEKEFSKYYSEA